MNIKIAQDYHSAELINEVARAWRGEQLLVVCPPNMKDHSFVAALEKQQDWPEPPVLGVFTSGTLSSSPRLILYSRRNVEAALDAIHALFDLSRIDHVFCYPQAFHTFGLTLGYVAALHRGWKLHTPLGKYSRESHACRIALKEKNVLTLGTPTHFFDLLSVCRESAQELTPSYTCILGGAVVQPKLWMDVQRDLKIEAPSIGYGCTEASPGITHLPPGIMPEIEGEIGTPLPSLSCTISTRGVCIQGPALCLAVLQGTKIEFPQRLWIRDQVRIGVNRSWQYLGRLDLTLNRGGLKFSLEAIERDLFESTKLAVVASAVRDTRLGEDLALTVVGADSAMPAIDQILQSRWGLQLPRERIRFVEQFPLNECSKLDRKTIARGFALAREANP